MIDAVDWSRRAATDLAVGILATSRQSAAQHVFLNDIERGPQALPDVLAATEIDDLFGPNWAVLFAVASVKARLRQHALVWFGQARFLHLLGCVDQSREILGDGENALDDLVVDLTFVADADLLEPVTRSHAVGANEPQHPGKHLVGTPSVMAVDDNYLGGFGLTDLVVSAKA